MVIVMKPSCRSPDEGLGYCTVKCQGSIPSERIREPRSCCGGQALGLLSLGHFWLPLGGETEQETLQKRTPCCLRVGNRRFLPLESLAAGG